MNSVSSWIADSSGHDLALWILGNVPGSPPILQTLHILSICALMASALFLDLRILGVAIPSQQIDEMAQRLRYWTVAGLLGVFCTGIWFVLARPARYFNNPVFQIKFSLMLPALACTAAIYLIAFKRPTFWRTHPWPSKLLAGVSALLWITVVLAGRWIAYSEYLFWPG